ncbi:MAG TPA: LysE family translocator [Acidothermaceae bacterium]|jgi:threonine/homoserine/homoserine lactone efflux protein
MSTFAAHLLAFAGAAFLLAIAPGPATAVLLRQTIRHGRARGFATVAGIESGVFFWAVMAALGVTALLSASEIAYTVLRVGGAVMLVFLGVQAILRSRSTQAEEPAAELAAASAVVGISRDSTRSAYRAGLVTNLANPKAGVFAVSFLPQFIPSGAPVLATGLLLAVIWVACDCTWYLSLTTAIHAARELFTRSTLRRRVERLTGVVLIGFGVRLAVQSQP